MSFIYSAVLAGVSVTAGLVGKGIQSSTARKTRVAEYKKLLTGKLLDAKLQQEAIRAKTEQRDTTIIVVASMSLLSIGALIYINNQNKSQIQTTV